MVLLLASAPFSRTKRLHGQLQWWWYLRRDVLLLVSVGSFRILGVTEFINEYPVVLVSTVDIHGAPHVVGRPAVLVDSRTYFGAPEDTAMARNLRRNPNVALAFAEPPWKRHVLMYGKVRFLEGGSDEEGLVLDAHQATHGYGTSGLVEALPENIFTWKGSP